LPEEFHARRAEEDRRCLSEGLGAVIGAVDFVRGLPPGLPKAIASSSTSRWIRVHLDHIGLRDVFGEHVYSGHEHVKRGKPAPDVYLHAAEQLGVPIRSCAIIEDSEVGATGALASGARVIGLVAGQHCGAGQAERLRKLGVLEIATSFDEVCGLLGLA
jgi:beta-phosphoglucomutase-like phosphatase (HAD superfamily)